MKYFFICLTFIFAQFSFALTTEQIESILNKSHRTSPFHGNILIKQNGTTLYKKSHGIANREWQVPHNLNSKFMIASLTKQFTAYAILNLAFEKKLNLEDSVSKYIKLPRKSPIDPKKWEAITIRHLLTHSSGLSRDIKRNENMSTSDYNLLGTIVFNVLNAGKIINKDPGQYYYSNLGYLLLAEVIEKVTSSYYISYLKTVIFNPLKMYNTDEYHRRKTIPMMAEGYFRGDSRKTNKRCCHDASIFTGSHNLYSTIEDLDIWNHELHGVTNILNRDVLNQMKEAQVQVDDKGTSYAFGLNVDNYQGLSRIWHTGHEWGYSTLLTYVPELKLSIVYLSNFHGEEIFSYFPNNVKFQNGLLDQMKN